PSFLNLSLDPEDAFFAVGIHEEILNHLAKLSKLNVISRTSMARYADSNLSIPEIAAELNVGAVMEGSVRYANDRVLVTMQLIDPETDAHLWSESYNRDLADVFAIQADIAMNVANALQAEFSVAEQHSIEAVPTESPEAYTLFLNAISFPGGTLQTLDIITTYLDEAIRLDPNFALAYSAKAAYYAGAINWAPEDMIVEFERDAQQNADRALTLDPAMGWAHAALAVIHQVHWRWDEAEKVFEEALRLSPNDAVMLSQYSRTKRIRGDYEGAIEATRKAVDLDPHSSNARYQLGIAYRYVRNYDAAAATFREFLLMDPASGNGHLQLGNLEVSLGNWPVAEIEFQFAERLYGADIQPQRITQLALAYAQMGRGDEVERWHEALQIHEENSQVSPALWAQMYIALNDYDQAIERLEIAIDDQVRGANALNDIKANPFAIAALDEPRFQTLRDQIGE
ncbi:MAG: tetratricopeptide repeat protein, partial [Proteobacteria bacterium]|nr:tetratricopeptide repeat protein [Pseudomonadota bacterium]